MNLPEGIKQAVSESGSPCVNVFRPYIPAAEMPIPCCPRVCWTRWNLEPYRSWANTPSIDFRGMPGPLSRIMSLRTSWSAIGMVWTNRLGSIPNSSQASSALSTPSFTAVTSAFCLLLKPSWAMFRSKYSLMLAWRCWLAMRSASERRAFAFFLAIRAKAPSQGCAGPSARSAYTPSKRPKISP